VTCDLICQVGRLLQLARVSVDFFNETLDVDLCAIEFQLLAILCQLLAPCPEMSSAQLKLLTKLDSY
jgi:hypothetical protein